MKSSMIETQPDRIKLTISSRIEYHEGEKVFELLQDKEFQAGWDTLYEVCPWATVNQSRAFVTTWYQVYRERHFPLLVKHVEGGKLTGLMTLAIPDAGTETSGLGKKSGRMYGAGHYDAEYQTWLTETTDDEDFIKVAILEVTKRFPYYDIQFKYIPSSIPVNWIGADKYWRRRCVLQSFRRPIMDMNNPSLSKRLNTETFRRKRNRLKRLGELRFEHITTKEQFASVYYELLIQYDFRQGARFNKIRFKDDHQKKEFLLALFEQNLLHVTVLKVDDKIQASMVAVAGKKWLHNAGINTHTPINAKYFSPGYTHFVMLGQQLQKEDVEFFDLSPGGDSYKEELATKHDEVYELLISNSFISNSKRRLRYRIYNYLLKAGKWPMGVELSWQKRIYILKNRIQLIKRCGLVNSIMYLKGSLFKTRQQKFFVANPTVTSSIEISIYKKNCLGDLLDFEARGTWMSQWEFLEDAMRRFEVGEHCYTWAEQNRLLGCAWVGRTKSSTSEGQNGTVDGVLLQGLYCHPSGKNHLHSFLRAVAAEAAASDNIKEVYALGTDVFMCRALKAAGFRLAKTR